MNDLERDEVELGGVKFRVLGPVQRVPVNPFPQKITIGDYTRDSDLVASTWAQTDWAGGFGSRLARFPQDQDRFWYSTCETRWPRALALPPKTLQVPVTVSGSRSPASAVQFGATPVIALGSTLLTLRSDLTVGVLRSYPDPITALLVTGGKLWVGGPSFLEQTTDLSTFTPVSGVVGRLLAELGGWVYAVQGDRSLKAYDGSAWNNAGSLPFPVEDTVALFPFPQPDGQVTLFAVVKGGLWVYDRTSLRWFPTQVTWPRGATVGVPTIWRGDVYIPVGSGILRWTGTTLSLAGPDRDEGLPPELPDRVTGVYGSYGFLVAALAGRVNPPSLTAVSPPPDPGASVLEVPTAQPVIPVRLQQATFDSPELVRESLLLASSGGGWSYLASDAQRTWVPIGVVERDGRIIFLADDGQNLILVPLPAGLHNPLRPQLAETAEQGVLLTPWFDAGWLEVPKVALRLRVDVDTLPAGCSLSLSYRTESLPWQFVGMVTTAGATTFDLGGALGTYPVFSKLQLRLTLQRTSGAATNTPIVSAVVLTFLRRPDQKFAYQLTLDCSAPWRGKSPEELAAHLLALAVAKQPFRFRFPTDPVPHTVILSRLQWAEIGGMVSFQGADQPAGRAAISVIEVS